MMPSARRDPRTRSRAAVLFRRDLAEHSRRPACFFFAGFMVFQAFLASRASWLVVSIDTSIGGQKAWVTSEFSIAYIAALIVFFTMSFFVAMVVGMPIVRDAESGIGPLLHATPLGPRQYAWGKFLAGLGACLGVVAVFFVSWMLFDHVLADPGDPEIYGPFRLGNYLHPFLVFILPGVVFTAAGSFLFAVIVRRAMALFVLPLVAFFGFNTVVWGWYPPELGDTAGRLLQWLDPSGFRWLKQQWLLTDRGLGFYNSEPIVYDLPFLASRLGWLVFSLALVAWAGRFVAAGARGRQVDFLGLGARLRQGLGAFGRLRRNLGRGSTESDDARSKAGLRALGMVGRSVDKARAIRVIFLAELRELRSRGAIWLFLALTSFFCFQMFNTLEGPFHTRLAISSGQAAVLQMGTLGGALILLLLFYVPDVLHRERATGFAPIFHALPTATGSILAGKLLAVLVLVLVTMLVALFTVWLYLAGIGSAFEPMPFAIVWLLLLLPSIVLWIALISASYAITGRRSSAHGVGLLFLFATLWGAFRGELNWLTNWMLIGELVWSDLSVFEIERRTLVLNRAFVLSVAALLFGLALRFFPRRHSDLLKDRRSTEPGAGAGLVRWGRIPTLVLVATPALIGWMLWTQVSRGFEAGAAELERERYWRENLATWLHAPDPHITDVRLAVDLFPETRGFRVQGDYELENRTAGSLARFAVTGGSFWSGLEWTVDGEPIEPENRHGLYVVSLERPLDPGERLRLGFAYEGAWPEGMGPGIGQFILPSGVLVNGRNPEFVPVIGYLADRGIDEDNRYEPEDAPIERHSGHVDGETDRSYFDCRLSVSVPADLTVNATGIRVGESRSGERKTVVWQSDAPIRVWNIVAGHWQERRGELGTAVFHDPRHAKNVDTMVEALDGAIRHYSEWFHPYPWQELRLNEFPGIALYAMGNATNILFSESIGFLADPSDSSAAFAITAHEAAHSWFGHIVGNGEGPGGITLSEGGAHFATLMLLEEMRGPAARQRFARDLESFYGENRQPDSEKPLVSTTWHRPGDQTVIYDRGGWVLWMLMQQMGREPFLAGMQDYFRTFYLHTDHPLVPDLVDALRPHAEDAVAFDAFVEQFLYATAIPEYRVAAAGKKKVGEVWRTEVSVRNAGTGRIPVVVAVTAGGRRFDGDGRPRDGYLEARSELVVGAGETGTLVVESSFEPERVVVDPDYHVLQLQRRAARVDLN